jgi:hypothetical protein
MSAMESATQTGWVNRAMKGDLPLLAAIKRIMVVHPRSLTHAPPGG